MKRLCSIGINLQCCSRLFILKTEHFLGFLTIDGKHHHYPYLSYRSAVYRSRHVQVVYFAAKEKIWNEEGERAEISTD